MPSLVMYMFIMTAFDFPEFESYDLIPGYRLKKASPSRILRIKEIIKMFEGPRLVRSLYEYDPEITYGKDRTSTNYMHLPENRWRYWVIESDDSNHEMQNIESAFGLMETDLQCGFDVMESPNSGFGWNAQKIHTFLNDRHHVYDKVKILREDDLKFGIECFHRIKEIGSKNHDIEIALSRLENLKSIPKNSDLMVIGLFSIVETLLTHNPQPNDPTDSLSRQIQSKMTLVEKRFKDPKVTEGMFLNMDNEKIWKKLYAFRSQIVHGGEVHKVKIGAQEKSLDEIVIYLKNIVKQLIILGLKEPVLITDLKSC
jgi:hypothetical protein